MKKFILVSVVSLSLTAVSAQAQNVTTDNGDIVMIEKHQAPSPVIAAPAGGAGVAPGLGGLTGFAPLGLGVGPLALGLGAVIAVGAISGGGGTGF